MQRVSSFMSFSPVSLPFDGVSAVEILLKHQTERPDLSKVPSAFVPILDRALSKDPAQRFQSLTEMSKQVESVLDARAEPAVRSSMGTTILHPTPEPLTTRTTASDRLANVSGSLLMATFLAGICAFVLGVLLKPDDWRGLTPVFFLTTLSSAAVLVSGKIWTRSVDESWVRRLIFMGLGLAIGLAALWFDGFDLPMPWSAGGQADSLRPLETSEPRHPFFGFLYPDNRSLPVVACYLSYFGLMFLALRWWKMSEEHRPQRFHVQPVLATVFWAYLLLFLLPAAQQRQAAFLSLVLTSVIVQLVSPWEPRNQERSKRLRLHHA